MCGCVCVECDTACMFVCVCLCVGWCVYVCVCWVWHLVIVCVLCMLMYVGCYVCWCMWFIICMCVCVECDTACMFVCYMCVWGGGAFWVCVCYVCNTQECRAVDTTHDKCVWCMCDLYVCVMGVMMCADLCGIMCVCVSVCIINVCHLCDLFVLHMCVEPLKPRTTGVCDSVYVINGMCVYYTRVCSRWHHARQVYAIYVSPVCVWYACWCVWM